jgi:hypothetical protein
VLDPVGLVVTVGLFHNSFVQVFLLTEIELAQFVLNDLANAKSTVNHNLLTSCIALAVHGIYIIVYLLIT